MTNKKTLACLALTLGVSLTAGVAPVAAQELVVKIGHVGPLTGNIANSSTNCDTLRR